MKVLDAGGSCLVQPRRRGGPKPYVLGGPLITVIVLQHFRDMAASLYARRLRLLAISAHRYRPYQQALSLCLLPLALAF